MADLLGCVVDFSNIDPSCFAIQKPGGAYPFLYAERRSNLSYTTASDGTITGITLKNGASLKKFTGRKFQNSGTFALKKSETGRTNFTHTVNERFYHSTQAERNSMEGLALAEDLVFFVPTNANQVEVFGKTLGLAASSAAGGTVIKLEDDNTALFAFAGDEPRLPALFQVAVTAGADPMEANLDYLDGLVATDAPTT